MKKLFALLLLLSFFQVEAQIKRYIGGGGGYTFTGDGTQLTKSNGAYAPADSAFIMALHSSGFYDFRYLPGQQTNTTAITALQNRSISTTYPLTGGGDFSTSRTHVLDTAHWHSKEYLDGVYGSLAVQNTNTSSISTLQSGKVDKTTTLTVNAQTFDFSTNRTFSITALSLLPIVTGNGGKFIQLNTGETALQWGGALASNIVNQYFNGWGNPVTLSYDSIPITVQSKTAAYTVAVGDNYVRADATSGSLTMTLQAASAYVTNKRIRFKKIDATANTVTIAAGGSDTIDGAATYVLTAAYQGVELMQTATNKWDVVGKF